MNGKWDIKLVIAGMGEMPATAVMKQDGDKISGTISGPAGDLAIAGTVTGKAVKIDFEADTPQGKLPVTMTGDIGASERVRQGEHRRHGRSGLDRNPRGGSVVTGEPCPGVPD